MAKLPQRDPRRIPVPRIPGGGPSFGGLNSANAALAASAGTGMHTLARGLGGIADQLQKQEDDAEQLALINARSERAAALIQERDALQNDPDHTTYEKRYRENVTRRLGEISSKLPQRARQIFDAEGQDDLARGVSNIRGLAQSKYADNGRANVEKILDTNKNTAIGAGPQDRAKIVSNTQDALKNAVRQGWISAAQAEKAMQGYLNDVGVGIISSFEPKARVEELKKGMKVKGGQRVWEKTGTYLDFIDPKVKARLLDSASAANDDALRLAVRDSVMVLNAGKNPPNLSVVRAEAKGTKYEKTLEDAVAVRSQMRRFSEQSIPKQRAELRRLSSKKTMTAREVRVFAAAERQHRDMLNTIRHGGGLDLAHDIGKMEEPVQLDLSNPDTLAARARQAAVASKQFGVPVSPLRPEEAGQVLANLEGASADQATGMLSNLRKGLGLSGASALAGQLTKDKKPEYGPALILTGTSPQFARDTLRGSKLRETNKDIPYPAKDMRDALTSVMGNMYAEADPETRDAYVAAAKSLYAYRHLQSGEADFSGDRFKQALKDVMGGVVEYNGRRVIPPKPMDETAFSNMIGKLTDKDLLKYGNGKPRFSNGKPFTASMLHPRGLLWGGGKAQLVQHSIGKYAIMMPGLGFVPNEKGGVYLLDLSDVQ